MNFFKKWLTVPKTNDTKEVEAAQIWYVRWMARDGIYHSDLKPVAQVFFSEENARAFAESLRQAFKLTQQFGAKYIEIEKSN